MNYQSTHTMSLGGQMMVIAIVLSGLGVFLYGLSSLIDGANPSSGNTVAYSYRAPSVANSSVQQMPTYTPTIHTAYRRPTVSYSSYTPQTHSFRGLASSGSTYRVHERRFTQAAYQGGNGSGTTGGGSSYATNTSTSMGSRHSSGVSLSMPILAVNSSRLSQATALETAVESTMRGPRRVYSLDALVDGHGNYWDEDAEDWLPIPGSDPTPQVGDTKYESGIEYTWNGSEWVVSSTEVDSPIGTLPVLLMLLLCGGYVVVKKRKESNLA